jgi:hypothetical protein
MLSLIWFVVFRYSAKPFSAQLNQPVGFALDTGFGDLSNSITHSAAEALPQKSDALSFRPGFSPVTLALGSRRTVLAVYSSSSRKFRCLNTS